ncbi:class I SAM-dependent methyltransferase [Mucilaginibacter limnophilus]|uniref:Class I SAM-dependent methyltransferase n=1 Tax=Mucilaginibacter limnophilus TaxID=1932778 RepID=A0A3S2UNV5_9SPHI|nr:class I SAM-dependent methyltransferase [Mucilaginibacter limnophilus]RVU00729.1 class I SAM-dependent methyltransferase [Mucilaginibacter limnophilus]
MFNHPEAILNEIAARNPKHEAHLRESLTGLGDWYEQKAADFLGRYSVYLENSGRQPDYGVHCYMEMVTHMREERMEFIRSGKYSNSSFAEVEQQVYSNPEIMNIHMHGLVLAQFMWYDQFQRFLFFSGNLPKYAAGAQNYLEIGGGHGLYIYEAFELLKDVKQFDMVDISESSINLAKGILNNDSINYYHKNLFDFDASVKYDVITIGEVLEHLEAPDQMLNKITELLTGNGVCYVTTPVNAPMIDHIYLFNNTDEIRELFDRCGLHILQETIAITDNKPSAYAEKYKIPIMYAAFVAKK